MRTRKIVWASCDKCGRDYPEGQGTWGFVYDTCPNCGFELTIDYSETRHFSLFLGRHELPKNEGAICSSFDFSTFKAVRTPLWDEAASYLKNGYDVAIYVTGLTPALTEFLSEIKNFKGGLYLLHYDSQKGEYVDVKF